MLSRVMLGRQCCSAPLRWYSKNAITVHERHRMTRLPDFSGHIRSVTQLRHPTSINLERTGTATTISRRESTLSSNAAEPQSLPEYAPPTRGLLSYLPRAAIPYAELSRIDKPAGAVYLFMPCLFSTLMAASVGVPAVEPSQVLTTSLLFLSGAVIMRGAGCTVNDLWDRDFDPQVARTRLRPIARGAVSPARGIAWAGVQHLAGLAILLQFPSQCLVYGIPSLLLVATYPLAKRVTHYPQVVLGLAFSWGAMMGFPALGLDMILGSERFWASAALYASCVSWTVLYDMIYAHMDARDDVKAGIKSIALRHFTNTKQVLSGLAVTQVGLLALAGSLAGLGPVFYVAGCGGAATTLAVMIRRVRLDKAADCWWWFKNGCYITGGAISAGLLAEYIIKLSGS